MMLVPFLIGTVGIVALVYDLAVGNSNSAGSYIVAGLCFLYVVAHVVRSRSRT